MSSLAKLAIGTAQWGMRYGIANQAGQTSWDEMVAILRTAKERGVAMLDTAHAYGDAEVRLGASGFVPDPAFSIVTKTLPLRSATVSRDAARRVDGAFRISLERLRTRSVYGLLVHAASDLLVPGAKRLWSVLEEHRANGRAAKIGVSVYHPRELLRIVDKFPIEIVQVPFNLYDDSFKDGGLLGELARRGVEVHARSVFLQGLLVLAARELPIEFDSIRDHHCRLHRELREAGLSPLEGALAYCLREQHIHRVIVGCETCAQFREVLNAAEKAEHARIPATSYSLRNEAIIDPSKWPKGSAPRKSAEPQHGAVCTPSGEAVKQGL